MTPLASFGLLPAHGAYDIDVFEKILTEAARLIRGIGRGYERLEIEFWPCAMLFTGPVRAGIAAARLGGFMLSQCSPPKRNIHH